MTDPAIEAARRYIANDDDLPPDLTEDLLGTIDDLKAKLEEQQTNINWRAEHDRALEAAHASINIYQRKATDLATQLAKLTEKCGDCAGLACETCGRSLAGPPPTENP